MYLARAVLDRQAPAQSDQSAGSCRGLDLVASCSQFYPKTTSSAWLIVDDHQIRIVIRARAARTFSLLICVDADMAVACSRKRLLFPTTPAIDKPHSSDPGHQIHFGREDEPARDRPEPQPVLRQGDVVLVPDLRDRVVAIDVKADFIGTEVLDVDELVSSQPRRGDTSLDDEDAAGGEMSAAFSKHRT